MTNPSKKTVNLWARLGYPMLMVWIVLGQVVRDVRQQGLETALHFWGLLVLISVAIGLIVGVAIVAVRWWLNRNGSTPNEPTKLC